MSVSGDRADEDVLNRMARTARRIGGMTMATMATVATVITLSRLIIVERRNNVGSGRVEE